MNRVHTLKTIKDLKDKDIYLCDVHTAVVYEARDAKNWNNACTILKDYLAPLVNAIQRAAENPSHARPKRITLWDAHWQDSNPLTMRPTEEDSRLVRWSIANLVRYAPSVSDSRTIFMFLLKLKPPLRDEMTVNHCLASLIYQYNTERNPEVRILGTDFVHVALQRGMGTIEYNAATSRKKPATDTRNTFLASVSNKVLRSRGLQISDDGLSLEPLPHQASRPPQFIPAPQRSQGPQQNSVPQQRPGPQPLSGLSQGGRGQSQFNLGHQRPTSQQSSQQQPQTQRHLMSPVQTPRGQSIPSNQKVMNENHHVGKSNLVVSAQTFTDPADDRREDQSAYHSSISDRPLTGVYHGGSNDTSRSSAGGSRNRFHDIDLVPVSGNAMIIQALNKLSLNINVAKEATLNKEGDNRNDRSPFCARLNRPSED
ncbi:hypothetical protein BGZ65_002600 [Modicella reniformis]|uniref:Uncharacterized protein n=1 Tax=Modicella reniformis TaxID=1440133 RepID=A0A9P6SMY4_9FUNG|nr:hypothetical protein BGZ65_002600 [Modicella reniformis]